MTSGLKIPAAAVRRVWMTMCRKVREYITSSGTLKLMRLIKNLEQRQMEYQANLARNSVVFRLASKAQTLVSSQSLGPSLLPGVQGSKSGSFFHELLS